MFFTSMATPLETLQGKQAGLTERFSGFLKNTLRLPPRPPELPQPNSSPLIPLIELQQEESSRGGNESQEEPPIPELTPTLIEWWRKLPRSIVEYGPGICRDGLTRYPDGKMLLIGQPGQEQQVMDTFELPWVVAMVRTMWEYRTGPQEVAERGFGLALMSEEIHKRMVVTQKAYMERAAPAVQRHVIVELNEQVFGDAVAWAKVKKAGAEVEGRPVRLVLVDFEGHRTVEEFIPEGTRENVLELMVINGDADEALIKMFSPKSFNIIVSDTHQLSPVYLGIHDMLRLKELKLRLKDRGIFIPLVWHRENLSGKVDSTQERLLSVDFMDVNILNYPETTVTVPPHCEYLPNVSRIRLPIVICRQPRFD